MRSEAGWGVGWAGTARDWPVCQKGGAQVAQSPPIPTPTAAPRRSGCIGCWRYSQLVVLDHRCRGSCKITPIWAKLQVIDYLQQVLLALYNMIIFTFMMCKGLNWSRHNGALSTRWWAVHHTHFISVCNRTSRCTAIWIVWECEHILGYAIIYLLWERNFPVACPEPSHPGMGHLQTIISLFNIFTLQINHNVITWEALNLAHL